MSNQDPLDRLTCFYQSLDAIPTPQLAVKPPSRWGSWTFAFVPFGAALVAYAFLAICASSAVSPSTASRPMISIDRYAVEEIRSLSPSEKPKVHALNRRTEEAVI